MDEQPEHHHQHERSPFPDSVTMGEVDYSGLPYIISLFVLILSLRKYHISPPLNCLYQKTPLWDVTHNRFGVFVKSGHPNNAS